MRRNSQKSGWGADVLRSVVRSSVLEYAAHNVTIGVAAFQQAIETLFAACRKNRKNDADSIDFLGRIRRKTFREVGKGSGVRLDPLERRQGFFFSEGKILL